MNEEQIEAHLVEGQAIIEGLIRDCEKKDVEIAHWKDLVHCGAEEIRQKDAEIERLRALCSRAADALAHFHPQSLEYNLLIAGLRKPAE